MEDWLCNRPLPDDGEGAATIAQVMSFAVDQPPKGLRKMQRALSSGGSGASFSLA